MLELGALVPARQARGRGDTHLGSVARCGAAAAILLCALIGSPSRGCTESGRGGDLDGASAEAVLRLATLGALLF